MQAPELPPGGLLTFCGIARRICDGERPTQAHAITWQRSAICRRIRRLHIARRPGRRLGLDFGRRNGRKRAADRARAAAASSVRFGDSTCISSDRRQLALLAATPPHRQFECALVGDCGRAIAARLASLRRAAVRTSFSVTGRELEELDKLVAHGAGNPDAGADRLCAPRAISGGASLPTRRRRYAAIRDGGLGLNATAGATRW